MSAGSFRRSTPLERMAANLQDARDCTQLVQDENARNALYSLIWAVEALSELHQLHSVK